MKKSRHTLLLLLIPLLCFSSCDELFLGSVIGAHIHTFVITKNDNALQPEDFDVTVTFCGEVLNDLTVIKTEYEIDGYESIDLDSLSFSNKASVLSKYISIGDNTIITIHVDGYEDIIFKEKDRDQYEHIILE